jgi:hypothetical protein
MIYRYRIPEPGTTISGLADRKKKKKKNNADRPYIFLTCDRKHTYFFILVLQLPELWKISENKTQYRI